MPKGAAVKSPAAALRRLIASCAATGVCASSALLAGPVASAADGRELLASAIANTRGSYLVYNFGAGAPAPMLNAGGGWYEMSNGGHLMIIKAASQRLTPRLLVDSHQSYQARCERTPGARTRDGLWQASEIYTPIAAWQALGQPTIAINANFFDVRGQTGGSWKQTGCSSPLGAYVDNTRGQGRANAAVTGTIAYAGKQGLSGGNEHWTALTTMILPVSGAPFVVTPKNTEDYDAATPVIQGLMDKGVRFVAVSGIGLLAPGDTGQLNDGGPSAARTAIAYAREKDELYVFQGGSYTPDQIQDLFRALGSDTAILLDGGGSSSIVLRRDTGGMWAGAGVPKGSCDTFQVLCDSRERALPSWLAFN
ncbi:phosphodiester glycosidase family protein [Mycolicibacterium confluentis]|uniref:phosphodiester glycosidase family protein n=1 Tax=Mycolicibacterium confluentis TaxID=28047 RepID=UPI000D6D790A|nr:phosphodiester glycosidase family protein [Mycolicibacterium confluentis]MCV7322933.1 phosphodiester glycosidase family protein [Mycolicibacterium confluentis]